MYAKDSHNPKWPVEPKHNKGCAVNVRYKTLPPEFPMQTTPAGPTSMKHIYEGPNRYPIIYKTSPVNSLYGADFSQYDANGALITPHFKAYPFTHRYVREVVDVAPVKQYEGIQSWPKRKW